MQYAYLIFCTGSMPPLLFLSIIIEASKVKKVVLSAVGHFLTPSGPSHTLVSFSSLYFFGIFVSLRLTIVPKVFAMLFLLATSFLVAHALRPLTPTKNLRFNYLSSQVNDENPVDDYYSMLNLFKPLDTEAEQVFQQASINSDDSIVKLAPVKRPSNKVEWDQWDAFMEEELGDLDPDITDENKWMLEVRDIVEQRRGTVIWSRKNENDINREIKKPGPKPLVVPEPAASIIMAVYIEQSKKLSQIKKDDPLGYMTFRKYMMDLKKKTKKDPVMLTKLELSKVSLLLF